MSEQMYLKCYYCDSDSEIFTVGQSYLVEDTDGLGRYRVSDNRGMATRVPLNGNIWKFELIKEQPEVTPKLTPRSLGCFQQVANVIGEDSAEIELQRVIDYPENDIGDDADKCLIDCFSWDDTPQGSDFWCDISDGEVPEELQTKEQTVDVPKSTPEFGDVLHIDGKSCLYILCDTDGDHHVVFGDGSSEYIYELSQFDEYRPTKPQELRNRILERWQRKSLENAYDTLVCRTELSVGDLVDFVVENIVDEFGE